MSESIWIPGLVVLAAGLLVGAFLARRLSRKAGLSKRVLQRTEREARVEDLEQRLSDLYRRLREEADTLIPGAREELENAAARTLRELDEAKGDGKTRSPQPAKSDSEAALPQTAGFARRRPLVTGFLLGGGMMAIVGLLIYWAVRDTAGQAGVPTAAAGTTDEAHPPATGLPAEAQAEHDALQARIQANPNDFGARRRLALLLLNHNELFGAFRQAQAILAAEPNDIDAQYVQGVVRLQMGQQDAALEHFNRVLELFPQHVQALGWKGIILYNTGNLGEAITTWELGIEAAGGQHPELEQMVLQALQEEAGVAPPPQPVQPSVAAPTGEMGANEGPAGAYSVRVELASSESPQPGSVLYVILREVANGPPVAVERVDNASFPLEVRLDGTDSMMGTGLPVRGEITVRLDSDGDAGTRSAEDLESVVTAEIGESIAVRLAG